MKTICLILFLLKSQYTFILRYSYFMYQALYLGDGRGELVEDLVHDLVAAGCCWPELGHGPGAGAASELGGPGAEQLRLREAEGDEGGEDNLDKSEDHSELDSETLVEFATHG